MYSLRSKKPRGEEWTHPVLYVGPDNEIKSALPSRAPDNCVRIVCVSDTHMQEELLKVPACDLLIHAGDALFKNVDADNTPSIEHVTSWLRKQNCRKQLFIGGNHEGPLDEMGAAACKKACPYYIEDELVKFDGLCIWGTPLSRPYKHGGESEEGDVLGGNKAFQNGLICARRRDPQKDRRAGHARCASRHLGHHQRQPSRLPRAGAQGAAGAAEAPHLWARPLPGGRAARRRTRVRRCRAWDGVRERLQPRRLRAEGRRPVVPACGH